MVDVQVSSFSDYYLVISSIWMQTSAMKHTKLSALHFYYMYKHVYVLENFFYLKRQFCLYKKKTLKITNIKQNKSCFASACSELQTPNQVVLNSLKGNQMDLIVYPYMTKL
jgi:hypothetical protein